MLPLYIHTKGTGQNYGMYGISLMHNNTWFAIYSINKIKVSFPRHVALHNVVLATATKAGYDFNLAIHSNFHTKAAIFTDRNQTTRLQY